MDVLNNKNTFITLCRKYIKREGIAQLLDWLSASDFFEAPASAKLHLSQKGGLCQHSLNVSKRLLELYHVTENHNQDKVETILIVSLFHDLCKVNYYINKAKENHREHYEITKELDVLIGHGVKSARIASKFIDITDEEYSAIVYHMGFSGDVGKSNPKIITQTFNNNELAVKLYVADTLATFIDE